MDPITRKWHLFFNDFRAPAPLLGQNYQGGSDNPGPNYNMPRYNSPRGYFRCRRNNRRRKQKSKFQNRNKSPNNHDPTNMNQNPQQNKSPEDDEEEERKKKLSDTANKLLTKLKSWSAENFVQEGENKPEGISHQELSGEDCKMNSGSTPVEQKNGEGELVKPKRIAHSQTKGNAPKHQPPKPPGQIIKGCMKTNKYDVNKRTVKDFQNRIQQKLINEIMQMPKENLQNVLNDPKINPIMELKMSRLVKENKLLIAQKLRAMAESKMKSSGVWPNPQFFVDIDKLIDPVIETDLSVLPYELIKEMENIFQVQFDFSNNESLQPQASLDVGGDSQNSSEIMFLNNCVADAELNQEELLMLQNMSAQNNLEFQECLTESAEVSSDIEEKNSEVNQKRGVDCFPDEDRNGSSSKKIKLHVESEIHPIRRENSSSFHQINSNQIGTFSPQVPPPCINNSEINQMKAFNNVESQVECKSIGCQTITISKDAETQTPKEENEPEILYGVPVPKVSIDNGFFSLLEEVNSIRNLINKLNERRFTIFLELARKNPYGGFVYDNFTCDNFLETIANGSIDLFNTLRQGCQGGICENSTAIPNQTKSAKRKKKNPNNEDKRGSVPCQTS